MKKIDKIQLSPVKRDSGLFFHFRNILSLILVSVSFFSLHGEGTKQVSPTEDDWVILNLRYGFAGYGTGGTDRGIAFEVLDPTEEVYLAFSQLAVGNYRTLSTSPYEFRILDAARNIVHGPFTIDPSNTNGDTYSEVFAGPDLGSGTGYDVSDPMYNFSPAATGTYYLEFRMNMPISASGSFNEGPAWWDISVADAGGTVQSGRVWSKNWNLRTTCDNCSDIFSQPFNGEVFVLTDDGFVHYIDFKGSGFRGLTFALAFNKNGPGTSGDPVEDRKSVNGADASNPEFQIFFGDPDPRLYNEPSIGGIQSGPDLVNSGQCDTLSVFCFQFDISQPGAIELVLDFHLGDSIFTAGTADLSLFRTFQDRGIFEVCTNWDRRDGLGNLVDLTAFIPTIVSYSQGNINFMLYDVENNNPGFDVDVIHPASAAANNLFSYDDSNLDPTDNDANLDMDNNPATGTNPPLFEFEGCPPPCHIWNRNTTSQSIGFGETNTINTWWSGNINYVNLSMRPFCRDDLFTIEKTVSNISPASSGSKDHFDVTFDILLKNEGTTIFDNIRLIDDMVANFGSAYIRTVNMPVVSAHAGNPVLPSIANFPNEIFDGTDGVIDFDEAIKVTFTVELNPLATGTWSSLSNQAFGFVTNEFSNTISGTSDDPTDPTSSTDPTQVFLPKIGLAKSITNLPGVPASSGNVNSFDVEYELIVENRGNVTLAGISLMDSIESKMGGAFVRIVSPPVIQASSTAAMPGDIDAGFTGKGNQIELLDKNGSLAPGEKLIIRYTVELAANAPGAIFVQPGVLENQAVAYGDFASFYVRDFSDSGFDPSDNTAPSGTNPDSDDDTGGADDPTLFRFPAIPEICNNMVDDDMDGLVDCDDPDCGVAVTLTADCETGLAVQNPQPGDSYVWRFEGNILAGETGDSFANPDDLEGNFSVEVTNSEGCSTTESILLNCCVIPSVPVISGER